jgi:hypothetical protein
METGTWQTEDSAQSIETLCEDRLHRMQLTKRRELICVAVLVVATALVYGKLLLGRTPWAHDHGVQWLKVIELERLLRSGHLTGWSDFEFAGYPANVLYPFGSYLVVAVLHVLPGVSLLTAYSWSVFLCLLGVALACYVVGRIHFSHATGVVAGLITLVDPGDFSIGGYSFSVNWGCWPCAAAGSGTLVAVALLPGALQRGTVRALAPVGILLGASVMFHPVALLLAVAIAPLVLLAAVTSEAPLPFKLLVQRLAIVVLGAIAACAFWVIPFLEAERLFGIHEMHWAPFRSADIWGALWDGSLYKLGLWQGAALCGLLLLARRADLFARLVVIAVPALIVLSTGDALVYLRVRYAHGQSPIDIMQLQRLCYLIRPLSFVAAAYALVTVAPSLRAWKGIGWRRMTLRVLAGLLAIFFVLLPGARLPVGDAIVDELSPMQHDALERALDAAKPLVGANDRLALYCSGANDHTLVGPAALRGFKIAKIGYMPQTQFKNQLWSDDPTALARAQVTAVLSRGPVSPSLAPFRLVGRYGEYEVRALQRLPRAWIEEGPGEVEVLEWGDRQIRVSVHGAGPRSRLRLMLGYYDAWRQANGAKLAPYDFRGLTMSTLPVTDGVVTLRFRTQARDWAGLILSLLGFAALALLDARERRKRMNAAAAAGSIVPPAPPAPPEASEPDSAAQ